MRKVNGIEKLTHFEAFTVCQENGWEFEDCSHSLRCCSYCDAYVNVDDFSGEREIYVNHKNTVIFDCCDECSDRIKSNENIDNYTYDDSDLIEEENE